jgi:hypothetical protein
MLSKLAKPLRGAFDKEMRRRLPGFKQVHTGERPKGGLLYAKDWDGRFKAYVGLQIADNEDLFTVNVAGSVKRRYPYGLSAAAWWDKRGPSYKVHDRTPCGEFLLRLGELRKPHRDRWWPVSSFKEPEVDDAAAWERYIFDDSVEAGIAPDRLAQSLADVFNRLEKDALPYFAAVSAAMATHGAMRLPKGEFPEFDDEAD